eukprot:scaffold65412_cov54-Phaeocystis_antarctica.AAC.1
MPAALQIRGLRQSRSGACALDALDTVSVSVCIPVSVAVLRRRRLWHEEVAQLGEEMAHGVEPLVDIADARVQ